MKKTYVEVICLRLLCFQCVSILECSGRSESLDRVLREQRCRKCDHQALTV